MKSVLNKIDARIGDLEPQKIYPITEAELETLNKGKGSIYFNFAIAFLTTALSATFAYITVNNLSFSGLAFLYAIMFSGYSFGFILLIIGYKTQIDFSKVISKISNRLKPSNLRKQ